MRKVRKLIQVVLHRGWSCFIFMWRKQVVEKKERMKERKKERKKERSYRYLPVPFLHETKSLPFNLAGEAVGALAQIKASTVKICTAIHPHVMMISLCNNNEHRKNIYLLGNGKRDAEK